MTRIDPAAIENGDLNEIALAISSMMPDRGMLGGGRRTAEFEAKLAPHKRTLQVPCTRLQTVLDGHGVSRLDAFIIDVEGADWVVARQLPLDRWHPRVVLLEYMHLNAYEQVACAAHFRNFGYRVYLEAGDRQNFLAVKSG
jgi:hypothetical protein